MAVDTFIKIGDIKGESTDAKHKDEVETLSWSWGLSNANSGVGGGGGTGKASFHDLSFTHVLDRASPLLMQACATGQHLKDATLTTRKAGKGQLEFLIVKMNDVVVTSVALSGSSDTPAESVTLQFAKIELEYKTQKPDGSLGEGVFFKFDIKANKAG